MDAQQLIELTTTTWNDRDRAGYHAAYHEDCEVTAPGFVGKGQLGVTEFWSCFMDAFPDNRVRLVHAVGGGSDIGAEESVFEGTHTGVLISSDGSEIPPTGRRVSAGFAAVHTARDGKLVSSHLYYDMLDFLTQLGVLAEPTAS